MDINLHMDSCVYAHTYIRTHTRRDTRTQCKYKDSITSSAHSTVCVDGFGFPVLPSTIMNMTAVYFDVIGMVCLVYGIVWYGPVRSGPVR